MKKIIKTTAFIIALTFAFTGLLGCATKNSGGSLSIYNWGDYIDESVLEDFTRETGIKVNYDPFSTNEDMYIKIQSGGANYDVAFPSDYMITRMLQENLLQKIDTGNISNYRYIEDRFRNLSYDPTNEYSVPYMWGTMGILYNKTLVEEPVDSWKILWDNKFKKQILMQDSPRDSIGLALKMLGYSMNTKNTSELEAAKLALIEQKPLVLAYVVDQVKDKMIVGEAAMAAVWSGDAYYCISENPELAYSIPKESTNLWFDSMVILKAGKNHEEAETFINFMCDPEVAFKNADYIGYATPHTEVKKRLAPELINDKNAYPTEDDVKECEVFEYLGDFVREYDRIWTEVKAH